MMPFSSKASRSGSSPAASSSLASAAAAKPRISAPNLDWNSAIRSLTGPGRAPVSSATPAMKQPPGNARRSRCAKNASHTAVSCGKPGAAARAGRTTSSAKIRAASSTIASRSPWSEPNRAYSPVLLTPRAEARPPMDTLSSPSAPAREAPACKIALRAGSPPARGRGGRRRSSGQASLIVVGT
jgi:hypothetical protein